MRKLTRNTVATVVILSVAVLAAACGSSSSSSGGGSGSGGSAGSSGGTQSSSPTSGPGLTQPYAPAGTRIQGGTVYFTQIPEQMPNYIFPMYSPQVCGTQNINQLMYMMYRPLYWFGNNYRPTIDYDYSIGQQPQFSGGGKTVTIKLNCVEVGGRRGRDLARSRVLDERDEGGSRDRVVRIRSRLLPRQRGQLLGAEPADVRIALQEGIQPGVGHLRRALAADTDPAGLGSDVPVRAGADLRQRSSAGYHQGRSGSGVQVPRRSVEGSRHVGHSPLWKVVDGPFKPGELQQQRPGHVCAQPGLLRARRSRRSRSW